MTSHGGARPGAGRPQKITFEPAPGATQTPMDWLWSELARRLGSDVANEIHVEYNRRQQIYQKCLIARDKARNEALRRHTRAYLPTSE